MHVGREPRMIERPPAASESGQMEIPPIDSTIRRSKRTKTSRTKEPEALGSTATDDAANTKHGSAVDHVTKGSAQVQPKMTSDSIAFHLTALASCHDNEVQSLKQELATITNALEESAADRQRKGDEIQDLQRTVTEWQSTSVAEARRAVEADLLLRKEMESLVSEHNGAREQQADQYTSVNNALISASGKLSMRKGML